MSEGAGICAQIMSMLKISAYMTRSMPIGLMTGFACAAMGYMYADSLGFLLKHWIESEDYSHGFFVPFITGYLIWQERARMAGVGVERAWWGAIVVAIGLLLYGIGELATLYVAAHLSLWMVIVGLILSFIGLKGAKAIQFPLFYLLTAVPLPVFLYANLSGQLQLLSSAMGVGCLQVIGITAFREGNVIDLGPIQLQVVEACSGIRYLFPLTALALLCAYLYKDAMWKRVVVVLSAIPISIFVNGLRIGLIGVLVEIYGQSAAEGFYHLFEGWALFMVSLGLLVGEMWVLTAFDSCDRPAHFLDRFGWRPGRSTPSHRAGNGRGIPVSFSGRPAYVFCVVLVLLVALMSTAFSERGDVAPSRAAFIDFPMQLSGWHGATVPLEQPYINALRFDDYVLADYRSQDGRPLNFYSAYYRSQKKGQSAHSPKSCLPGGGWEISSLTEVSLPTAVPAAETFHANRALIQKDDQKQVVLYWFKQRERLLADEYQVKFYLLWDALWRSRTDGALIRIASVVGQGETEDSVDRRLRQFAGLVQPELPRYVPD